MPTPTRYPGPLAATKPTAYPLHTNTYGTTCPSQLTYAPSHGNIPPPNSAAPPNLATTQWRIPEVSRGAKEEGWKQIIHNWKYALPPELKVPLKDWKEDWYKDSGQHTLYLQRKMIAEEFIDECVLSSLFFRAKASHL
jgi:hypothetical protein